MVVGTHRTNFMHGVVQTMVFSIQNGKAFPHLNKTSFPKHNSSLDARFRAPNSTLLSHIDAVSSEMSSHNLSTVTITGSRENAAKIRMSEIFGRLETAKKTLDDEDSFDDVVDASRGNMTNI